TSSDGASLLPALLTIGPNTPPTAAQIKSYLNRLPGLGSANYQLFGPAGGPFFISYFNNFNSHDTSGKLVVTGTAVTPPQPTTVSAGGQNAPLTGNEIQQLNFAGTTGGTFTLSFNGFTTPAISYQVPSGGFQNTMAGDIQTALTGLFSIGAGNVQVTSQA